MRWVTAAGTLLWLWCVAGCSSGTTWTAPTQPSNTVLLDNPLLVPPGDPEYVWETVVQVIGDYFRVEREVPIRQIGDDDFTEGYLETFPLVGSTIFEPWAHDTANSYERIESTLQTMRRTAVVRVVSVRGHGGFQVQVSVFKDLEDLPQPALATSGPAAFHYDGTTPRIINPIDEQETNSSWIKQGHDPALEQRLLGQMYYRFFGGPAANPIRLSQTAPATTAK
jgi:hypothetical protein